MRTLARYLKKLYILICVLIEATINENLMPTFPEKLQDIQIIIIYIYIYIYSREQGSTIKKIGIIP